MLLGQPFRKGTDNFSGLVLGVVCEMQKTTAGRVCSSAFRRAIMKQA
jgi:hypothetical protein